MNGKTLLGTAALAAAIGTAGCAAPGGGYGYGAPNAGYQTGQGAYQAPAGSVFYGRVEAIEPIQQPRGASSGCSWTTRTGSPKASPACPLFTPVALSSPARMSWRKPAAERFLS